MALKIILSKKLFLGISATVSILFSGCYSDNSSNNLAQPLDRTTSTSPQVNKEEKASSQQEKSKSTSIFVELQEPKEPSYSTSCSKTQTWEGTWELLPERGTKLINVSLDAQQNWYFYLLDESGMPRELLKRKVKKISSSTKLPESVKNPSRELTQREQNKTQGTKNCLDDQKWIGTWKMTSYPSLQNTTIILHPDHRWSIIQHNEFGTPFRVRNLKANKIINKSDALHIREIETNAKKAIRTINTAQFWYRLKNPTYAHSSNELSIDQVPNIDKFYDIQIVSADTHQAYVTAKAKRSDIKSFSGMTVKDKSRRIIDLCETEAASQTLPPINCHSSSPPPREGDITTNPVKSGSPSPRVLEAKARKLLGTINRAQQAYRLEHPNFANSYNELFRGDFGSNEFYDFQIVSADSDHAYVTASAKKPNFKSFRGVVRAISF